MVRLSRNHHSRMSWPSAFGLDPILLRAIFSRACSRLCARAAVVVAQSVRAPDCGSGGCGFDPRQPPWKMPDPKAGEPAQRSVAQVVEHRSPKPGVAGSSPAGPVGEAIFHTALSSRGLGRGPLKAQTRVRIPLALFREAVGPIVYRLGRDPFKVERGVRLPLGL